MPNTILWRGLFHFFLLMFVQTITWWNFWGWLWAWSAWRREWACPRPVRWVYRWWSDCRGWRLHSPGELTECWLAPDGSCKKWKMGKIWLHQWNYITQSFRFNARHCRGITQMASWSSGVSRSFIVQNHSINSSTRKYCKMQVFSNLLPCCMLLELCENFL